jgi:hypothetical protein
MDEPRLVLQDGHGKEHVAAARRDQFRLCIGGGKLRGDKRRTPQHAAGDDEG